MTGFHDYAQYDGLGLAELVRKKEVHPKELITAAIHRIEDLNPQLNAVIHKMYDLARKTAEGNLPDGPFKGVPFLLKDLLADYAGVPTRRGSRFYKDFVPDGDCEIVRRYKAAGVIVLGKTNTPEYGLLPVTEPELFGPSRNPWDPARTTGGSSGGSAAAVAARMTPFSHGNDGGGSIRIPASCCGVFGLKPTRGRTPLGPDRGEAWQGLVCNHVLTRSVRDSAAMLDATAGPDVGALYFPPPPSRLFREEVGTDPGTLHIAFTSKSFLPGAVHKDCVQGLEATVKLCQDLGHEVVEAAPEVDGEAFARAFLTMVCVETRADIEESETLFGRKATFKDFEPGTWASALIGKQIRAPEFSRANRLLQSSGRLFGQFFEDYDVLMTPTLAGPPVEIGALQPRGLEAFSMKLLGSLHAGGLLKRFGGIDAIVDKILGFIPYTPLFNATGQPAMSIPLHWNDEGLPIGIHFVGRYGDEATLFRLAGQLEQAKPWAGHIPPICREVK
ncbi:MAG: amidase [Deltaproteobacteria bacterium]|nr:amidase [Deltaproteobacteria bacterium]